MKNYNFFILFGKKTEEAIDLIEDLQKLSEDDIRLIFIENMFAGVIKLDNIDQSICHMVNSIWEFIGLLDKELSKEEKISEFFGFNIPITKMGKNSSVSKTERQEFIRKMINFSNICKGIIFAILIGKTEGVSIVDQLAGAIEKDYFDRISLDEHYKMFDFMDKLEDFSIFDKKLVFMEFFGERHFYDDIVEIKEKSSISRDKREKLLKELEKFPKRIAARLYLVCTHEISEEEVQNILEKLPPEIRKKL